MISEQFLPGRWRLSFAEPEAIFLMNVLAGLARHYREDLESLSPELRRYWRDGSSLPATPPANDPAGDESREMLAESRAELRSERADLAETWLRDFEIAEERDPWIVELTTAERDEFVCLLNDRRLILALEAGLTGEEKLHGPMPDDRRRLAVMEIDVLGSFVMVTLGPQIFRP